MKLSFYRSIFQNRFVSQIFIMVLVVFLSTNFFSEWKLSIQKVNANLADTQNYQAIVKNAILLDGCYVESPNEKYCFDVLKIISSQLNDATFKTSNIKYIWTNCYLYLSSVYLKNYPKIHDRWVRLAINEDIVSGKEIDYTPSTPNNIEKFQSELRREYRERIKLEIFVKEQKLPALKK